MCHRSLVTNSDHHSLEALVCSRLEVTMERREINFYELKALAQLLCKIGSRHLTSVCTLC